MIFSEDLRFASGAERVAALNMSTIAFLGTGTMGRSMARNLAAAGFAVRAWTPGDDWPDLLADAGVTVCERASDAACEAAVMITMLSDPDAVLEIAPAAVRALPSSAVWVQMSTLGHDATDQCAERAERAGVQFLDAPVLGTCRAAQEGRLVVLASGDQQAIDSCERIFEAVGSVTVRTGSAGSGARVKLAACRWTSEVVATVLAGGTGLASNDPTAEGMAADLQQLQSMLLEEILEHLCQAAPTEVPVNDAERKRQEPRPIDEAGAADHAYASEHQD